MKGMRNPVKAIRTYCLECKSHHVSQIKNCERVDCPLYAFRMGKNPYRKPRTLTDEQRKAMVDRLSNARAAKFNKD